jgi:hypothetical protein
MPMQRTLNRRERLDLLRNEVVWTERKAAKCEQNHTPEARISSHNRDQPVQNSRRNHRNGELLIRSLLALSLMVQE